MPQLNMSSCNQQSLVAAFVVTRRGSTLLSAALYETHARFQSERRNYGNEVAHLHTIGYPTPIMILLTAVRLPNGYRLIAATPCCANRYHWHLWRNQQPTGLGLETTSINNVIAFDLTGAVVPGDYYVRVDHTRVGFNGSRETWVEQSAALFLPITPHEDLEM